MPASGAAPRYTDDRTPTFGNGSCRKILPHPTGETRPFFLAFGGGGCYRIARRQADRDSIGTAGERRPSL